MEKDLIAALTARDEKYAFAAAERIIAESRETDAWYEYLPSFAALLDHPKSLVRNRALWILAANAQWDEEGRYDALLPRILEHITDEKPITARQCVQCLRELGEGQRRYIPEILRAIRGADLSPYQDSMRPLIEKDMAATEAALREAEKEE